MTDASYRIIVTAHGDPDNSRLIYMPQSKASGAWATIGVAPTLEDAARLMQDRIRGDECVVSWYDASGRAMRTEHIDDPEPAPQPSHPPRRTEAEHKFAKTVGRWTLAAIWVACFLIIGVIAKNMH